MKVLQTQVLLYTEEWKRFNGEIFLYLSSAFSLTDGEVTPTTAGYGGVYGRHGDHYAAAATVPVLSNLFP